MLGIKSSTKQLQFDNKYTPGLELVEFHLTFEDIPKLGGIVAHYHKQHPDLKFTFHCPVIETGGYMSLADYSHVDLIKPIINLCRERDYCLGFVMHIEDYKFGVTTEVEKSIAELKKFDPDVANIMYVENQCGKLTNDFDAFLELLDKHSLTHACFDFAHFSAFHSEEEFYAAVETITKRKDVYFHMSDVFFNDKSSQPLNIGKGKIDYSQVLPFVKFAISETISEPEDEGKEMKEDYRKLKSFGF